MNIEYIEFKFFMLIQEYHCFILRLVEFITRNKTSF